MSSSISGDDEHGGERRVPAMARVERRLAHEPVHAGLRAEPPERVFAAEVQRRALDARDLAGRLVEHVDREAVLLAPAQVHPKQHRGPVLRLGAAGAGLDVEERVVRVHLAREHAPKLECSDVGRDAVHLADQVREQGRVVFLARERVQLLGFAERLVDAAQRADDGLELRALAPQALRTLRVAPDVRVLELAVDLF